MKWEYLVEGLPTHQGSNIGIVKAVSPQSHVMAYLNQRGEEGWELVQIAMANGQVVCDIYSTSVVFVFKRPRV